MQNKREFIVEQKKIIYINYKNGQPQCNYYKKKPVNSICKLRIDRNLFCQFFSIL